MTDSLIIETVGRAMVVTVNRPDKLNALNSEVLASLAQVLVEVSARPRTDIVGVVLTGAGERAFIAGADIAEMSAMDAAEAANFAALGQRVPDLMEQLDRPVIAAVNGYALGGGCEMAMGADFIYASANAVFGQPEVALGLIPCFGGCTRLPSRVGLGRARELIATGRKFDASQAAQWGLVNEVYPDRAALMAAALATIDEIADQAPGAVGASKAALRSGNEQGHHEGLSAERDWFTAMFATEDMREGTTAFLTRRRPVFGDR